MTTDIERFDNATLCRLVEESLGLLDRVNPAVRAVRVKSVKIDDTVILVDFYAESRDLTSVQAEIIAVMGALSGLLGTNELSERPILHYGVRAWENASSWLVYAVCSAETAKKAGMGEAIDWLRGTQFEVNTADWRLARAKALTSRIEIGLRDYIDSAATSAWGASWWKPVMANGLENARSQAERQARRSEMTSPSSRELLDFTYLSDLSNIVQAHWSEIGTAWSDPATFATEMARLNKIRRSEAHNRAIGEQELADLEAIYDRILESIAQTYPAVVPQYLEDKWRLQLLRVAEKLRDAWGQGEPRRDLAELLVRVGGFQTAASRVVDELTSIRVPHGRTALHQELIDAIRLAADSTEKMLLAAKKAKVPELEEAFKDFQNAMQGIRRFEQSLLLSLT